MVRGGCVDSGIGVGVCVCVYVGVGVRIGLGLGVGGGVVMVRWLCLWWIDGSVSVVV